MSPTLLVVADSKDVDMLKRVFIPLTGVDVDQVMFVTSMPDVVPESVKICILADMLWMKQLYKELNAADWEGHILPERNI